MSSFMLSNKSLSAIGSAVSRCQEGAADFGLGEDAETITKSLYDLNAAGVRERYEDADKAGMIQPLEFVNHQLPLQPIQFFKSLQCLRYEASEGDVYQRDDFKKLESLILWVAEKIIRALPEYDRAKWD